ncbi:MAG: FGGY-family carbohydrate kinase [Clostridia bacterium]
MNRYVLGIDNGGTSTKAVLFDISGREIAQAKASTPMLTPQPGFTERDMEVLWQCNCDVIRRTIAQARVDPSEIVGVSFSGHGKGLYLWGKDEKPARPGIVSTDSRAYRYVEEWYQDGTAEKLFALTCQSILASQPVSLIRWLMDNEPEVIENTRYIFGVKDYIRYRMTGEAYGEITDLSGSNLVNLRSAQYDPQILSLLHLEGIRDKLPPLVYSSAFCGQVTRQCAEATGLAAGTPVAAGLFDIDACAIAMNVVDAQYLACIAGTWSINEYVSPVPVMDHSVKMNSLYCLSGQYLVEECSPTSAANHEWFVNNFLREAAEKAGKSVYQLANELVTDIRPSDQSIIFLPYLYGGADDARATAAFVGLDASHTRSDMLRAVYECIIFGHKQHIDRLLASRVQPPKAIRLAGGVVNSPMWVQMFADILNLPVETIDVKELGALGCAMTAAVAAGDYPDLCAAARAMVKVERTFLPDCANQAVYARKYDTYLAVRQALSTVWDKLKK